MKKAKSCPPGKYWCFTDKKCKKIPLGYHIGLRGYLYPDEDGKSNNGNGSDNGHSGNGNGSNGNGGGGGVSEMKENFKRLNTSGQTYAIMLSFRGKTYNIQMFIPKQTRPNRLEVEQEVNKIYPGAIVRYFEPRVWDPTSPALLVPEEMQPVLQQKKNQTNHKKKKHSCGEEFTLKSVEEALSTKDAKKLNKAAVLSTSKDPKDWDSARARQVDVDFKDMMRQRSAKKRIKKVNEIHAKENLTYDIDPKKHRKERRDAKIGNLARKTTNPGEKSAAEKKSKGPKLFG